MLIFCLEFLSKISFELRRDVGPYERGTEGSCNGFRSGIIDEEGCDGGKAVEERST